MTKIIFITILILITITFNIYYGRKVSIRAKRMREVFKDREKLSSQELYEKFFLEEGVPASIVIKIREIFEEKLGYDFSQLRKDDDFSQELIGIWDLDSMADVEIAMEIEEVFHIELSDEESANMKTLSNIVNTIWTKQKNSIPKKK